MKTIKLSKGRWDLIPKTKKLNLFGVRYALRKTSKGNVLLPVKIISP